MILLEEVVKSAEVYDIITFLNRFWFQIVEFVVIAALMVVAIILGAKLRKLTDAHKAKKEAAEASENVAAAAGTTEATPEEK